MSWEWLALGAIATLVIVMIIFRKNPLVEKYWKYTLILAPAVILIILSLINRRRGQNGQETTAAENLSSTIGQIKNDLVETQMTAAIKVSAAKQKQDDKIQQLLEIKKIDDQDERLRRLAAMMS